MHICVSTGVEKEVNVTAGVEQSVNTNVFSFSIASSNCNVNTSNLLEPIKINFPIQVCSDQSDPVLCSIYRPVS